MESYERLPTRDEVAQFARHLSLPAERLWEIAIEAWDAPAVPLRTATLRIACVTLPYPVHCFLVAAADGSCLVIDTGTEAGPLLAKIRETGWQVAAILITHGHGDHTGGLTEVQRATGAPVYIGAPDASAAAHVPPDAVHRIAADRQFFVGITRGTGHSYARSHAGQRQLPDRRNGIRRRYHVCRLRRGHALARGLPGHSPVRPGAAAATAAGDARVPGARSPPRR